jgi:N-acetylmuramoyl-L-alanine amidase
MSGRRLMPQPDAEGTGGAAPVGFGSVADIELFARTLWSEAAGESLRGVEAVAAVVMNRAATLTEGAIDDACRSFACWSSDNPDLARIAGLKAGAGSTAELLFTTCLRIARRAVAGLLEDLTGGATHYHDRSTLPDWTAGREMAAEIGNRLFYKGLPDDKGGKDMDAGPGAPS